MQLKRCCFPCAVNADLCGRPRRRASVGWWGGSDPCSAVGIHYFIRRFGRLPGREQPRTCRCGSDTNTLPWNKGTPHPHICSAARRLLCTPKPPPVTLRTAAGRSAALIFFFLIFFFHLVLSGRRRGSAGTRRQGRLCSVRALHIAREAGGSCWRVSRFPSRRKRNCCCCRACSPDRDESSCETSLFYSCDHVPQQNLPGWEGGESRGRKTTFYELV